MRVHGDTVFMRSSHYGVIVFPRQARPRFDDVRTAPRELFDGLRRFLR